MPRAEQAVEPLAVVGGLDLVGIGGADGGDLVRVDQAALHKGGRAEELELVAGVGVPAQAHEVLDVVHAEHALVLQVVDGEHRVDALVEGQGRVLTLEQHGDQARLPVVAVQDVGLVVDQGQGLEHRPVEEGEALALVAAPAVDRGPVVVELVIDEVEGHAVELERFDAAVLPPPAEVDVKVRQVLHLLPPLGRDVAVQGKDDAHFRAQLLELLRKGAGHVRQTAGLDKGYALRGCKQDLHASPAFLVDCTVPSRKREGGKGTRTPLPALSFSLLLCAS